MSEIVNLLACLEHLTNLKRNWRNLTHSTLDFALIGILLKLEANIKVKLYLFWLFGTFPFFRKTEWVFLEIWG